MKVSGREGPGGGPGAGAGSDAGAAAVRVGRRPEARGGRSPSLTVWAPAQRAAPRRPAEGRGRVRPREPAGLAVAEGGKRCWELLAG